MNNQFKITIKDENQLWFFEKNIPVFDCLELFQKESIVDKEGNSLKLGSEPKAVKFETDLGWSFESFIEKGKFFISERSSSRPGTTLFIKESKVKVGDSILIEKLNDFHFNLSVVRG